ncbi:MAG TPA: hypothetical protein VFN66_05950 [Burkholderiales bacterium]|nr:hypothetical protein [Burkholderiales bacterium]
MSLFQPLRRATLLYPSGPAHDINRKHLFILLTDPVNNPENGKVSVLLTSLSTLNPVIEHDPTFILYPGDHPFVTRNSYVSYAHARIEEAESINQIVDLNGYVAIFSSPFCHSLLYFRQSDDYIGNRFLLYC